MATGASEVLLVNPINFVKFRMQRPVPLAVCAKSLVVPVKLGHLGVLSGLGFVGGCRVLGVENLGSRLSNELRSCGSLEQKHTKPVVSLHEEKKLGS